MSCTLLEQTGKMLNEAQENGTAVSRKSIAAFIATIVDNPEKWKNENLGISKPNS